MNTERKTIRDYPRIYKSPTQRSPEAIANYDAFHVRSVESGWVWGEHPGINWCIRHNCATYLEAVKSHCDLCGKEALEFWLSLKVHKPLKGDHPIPKATPDRRRGDITGRKAGRVQPSRAFNPQRFGPRPERDNLFIERRP